MKITKRQTPDPKRTAKPSVPKVTSALLQEGEATSNLTDAYEDSGEQKNTSQEPIWWEKTVEYLFALQYLKDYKVICPLAGTHERAGDVIAGTGTKWCLIEFKRYPPTKAEKIRASENVKFKGTPDAKKNLDEFRAADGMDKILVFHHIAFGKPLKTRPSITLGAHDYWDSAASRTLNSLLATGTRDGDLFFQYIKLFVAAKGGGKDGDRGSNGGGPDAPPDDDKPTSPTGGPDKRVDPSKKNDNISFMNVLAVTVEKGIFCCPLDEFHSLITSSDDSGPGSDGSPPSMPPSGPRGRDGAEVMIHIQKNLDTFDLLKDPAQRELAMLLNEPERA